MKTILFITAFLSAGITAFSQNQLAVYAGPQITSALYRVDGSKQMVKSKKGFQLGTGLKIPFDNHLFFAPTAFYSLKGYNVRLSDPNPQPNIEATSNDTKIHTFEIGILFQYDLSLKADHVYFKAGPALDFQLAGKETYTLSDKSKVKQDMRYSFSEYGRVGANLMLEVGYEIKNHYFFGARFSHGVGSVNNADFGPSILHRVYGITIGKYLRTN